MFRKSKGIVIYRTEAEKEVRETGKIDQTIEAICGYIQTLIHVGRAGDAAELTNALAALITARGDLEETYFRV